MHATFIVYKGQPYRTYRSVEGGVFLLSRDPQSISEGYEEADGFFQKFIPNKEIEKKYRIIDFAIFDGRRFPIIGSSDAHFDQPNSGVKICTDDVDFLKEHGLYDTAEIYDNQYGHLYYATEKIPASQVQILRVREDRPID